MSPLSALALLAIFPLAAYLFGRMPPTRAGATTLVYAMLIPPAGPSWLLPLVPPADKYSIAVVAMTFFAMSRTRSRWRGARVGAGIDWIVISYMIALLGTIFSNPDPIVVAGHFMPGLSLHDYVQWVLRDVTGAALPLILGRVFIRSGQDIVILMRVLVIAALLYSAPILWEIRMSPQLQGQIYHDGVDATFFVQNMRAGGFRACVFMGHGLIVSFFLCVALLSAATLLSWNKKLRIGQFKLLHVFLFLFVVLILNKSSAALIYTVVMGGLTLFGSQNAKMRTAVGFCIFVMIYPMLRVNESFPVQGMVDFATEHFGADRSQSLGFRFDNEEALIKRAALRSTWGWGGYGRERIYEPNTGKDLTVEDSVWIIIYCMRGVMGFITYFSLFTLPPIYLWWRIKRVPDEGDRKLLSGLSLLVTVCAIDMLPNGSVPVLPMFLAGGLYSATRELSSKRRQRAPTPAVARGVPAGMAPNVARHA